MVAQQAQNVSEALRYTPGVSLDLYSATTFFDAVKIRGFDAPRYLDGLRLPLDQGTQFAFPRVEPYGLERLEVLRGPSSGLYGQTEPGGLINMVSKRPLWLPHYSVEGTFGSFDRFQGAFDIGGPIDRNREFLYRVVGLGRMSNRSMISSPTTRSSSPRVSPGRRPRTPRSRCSAHYQNRTTRASSNTCRAASRAGAESVRARSYSRYIGEPSARPLQARTGRDRLRVRAPVQQRLPGPAELPLHRRHQRFHRHPLRRHATGFPLSRSSFNYVWSAAETSRSTTRCRRTSRPGRSRTRSLPGRLHPYGHALRVPQRVPRPDRRLRSRCTARRCRRPTRCCRSSSPPNAGSGRRLPAGSDQDRPLHAVVTGRQDWADAETVSTAAYPFTGTNLQKDRPPPAASASATCSISVSRLTRATPPRSSRSGTDLSGNCSSRPPAKARRSASSIQPNGMNLLLTAAVFEIPAKRAHDRSDQRSSACRPAKPGCAASSSRRAATSPGSWRSSAATASSIPRWTTSERRHSRQLHAAGGARQASLWAKYTWYNGPLAGFGLGAGIRYVGENYGDAANTFESRRTRCTMRRSATTSDICGRISRVERPGQRPQPRRSILRVVLCDRAGLLRPRRFPHACSDAALWLVTDEWPWRVRAFRKWSWVHKWSSLVCTLFMLLLCITGLPLIFHEQIDELLHEQVKPAEVPAGTPKADLDRVVANGMARAPGQVVHFLIWDPHEDEHAAVVASASRIDVDPSTNRFVRVDAHTADYLDTPDFTRRFTYIVYKLHVDLFAGLPGKLFLGLMGILFCVAIISGIVVYAPSMRKLAVRHLPRRPQSRVRWLDIHNLAGVVACHVGAGRRLHRRDQHLGRSRRQDVAVRPARRDDGQLPRQAAGHQDWRRSRRRCATALAANPA